MAVDLRAVAAGRPDPRLAPVITTEGLGRSYDSPSGPVPALAGVTFTALPGEVVAIMGPSGSGKPNPGL
ncbi:hypothetical protein [Acrocarpospora sp. B8E8]|uniref:hypothetical protein n=1 Tax=Acrocarpospora sp. B8E8 TaxID=3153572 RepID=UPI00325EDBB3